MRDVASDDLTDDEEDIGPIDLTKDEIFDSTISYGLPVHKPVSVTQPAAQPSQIVKPITSLQTAIRSSPLKHRADRLWRVLTPAPVRNPVAPPPSFSRMDNIPLQRNFAPSEYVPPASTQPHSFNQYLPPLQYPPTVSQPQLFDQRLSQTYAPHQLLQQRPPLQQGPPTNSLSKVIYQYPPLQGPPPTQTPAQLGNQPTPPPSRQAVIPPSLPASQRRPPSPPKPPTKKPRTPVPHNPIEAETPHFSSLSPQVPCSLCRQNHTGGKCPLRNEALQQCPGCGFYHLHMHRSCPLLQDLHYVELMHKRLSESTEDIEIVQAARKYITGVKGDLHRRVKEPLPKQREQKGDKKESSQ